MSVRFLTYAWPSHYFWWVYMVNILCINYVLNIKKWRKNTLKKAKPFQNYVTGKKIPSEFHFQQLLILIQSYRHFSKILHVFVVTSSLDSASFPCYNWKWAHIWPLLPFQSQFLGIFRQNLYYTLLHNIKYYFHRKFTDNRNLNGPELGKIGWFFTQIGHVWGHVTQFATMLPLKLWM